MSADHSSPDTKIEDTHYAAVLCIHCGQVPLSESEYNHQMKLPHRLWGCPRCGDDAEFDDEYFEDHHGIE